MGVSGIKYKWYSSPWTLTIGGALLSSIIFPGIYALIKDVSFISAFKSILIWLREAVVTVLTFEVKMWHLLILFTVLFVVLWVVAKIQNETPGNVGKDFTSYTRDSIKGLDYSWSWSQRQSGKWAMTNLRAHCPKCETALSVEEGAWDSEHVCPRCDSRYPLDHTKEYSKIEQIIHDNIDREIYKQNRTN